MSNYDFTLEDKSQKSKKKSMSSNLSSDCIEGFIEDDCKHGLFDEISSPIQIPLGNLIQLIFIIQQNLFLYFK